MKDPRLLEENNNGGAIQTSKKASNTLLGYLKSGIALYWASFFLLIIIEFFLGGQLSKILSKQHYTLFVTVLNTLPFYNVLVNVGISYVIIYMVSYNQEIKYKLFRSGLRLQTIWYFFLVAIHVVLLLVFRNAVAEYLLITIIISYAYSYRLNMNALFLSTRSYNRAAVSSMLQKTGLFVIIAVIASSASLKQFFNEHFVIAFPILEVSMVVLYFVVFWKTNYRSIIAPKISYRRRIVKYGKYSMLNNGMNVFYYLIIAIIIRSSLLDAHTKIIMSLCIVFFRYSGAVVAPFVSITIPYFAKIKNEMGRVRSLYKKYFVFILLLGLMTMVGCRLFFGYVIEKFYSPSYHDIPAYFYFFAYLIPLLFINALNTQLIAAMGKIKFTFWAEFVCTIVLVLFYVYNLMFPIIDFHVLYYMVLIHLSAKFIMLNYGLYVAIMKK